MKILWTTNQLSFATIGGFIGWFLGGFDGLLYALLAFIIIDYITGVLCAIENHELSSEVGFKGVTRKCMIILLVGIANIVDIDVIGTGSVLRAAVCFFYISNEGLSILENAAILGLPIPEQLKKVLKQIKNRAGNEKLKGDKNDENSENNN